MDLFQKKDKTQFEEILNSISYWKPNDYGMDKLNSNGYYVGFRHRRLSILDLTKYGHQPIYDKTNNYIIVFNGEIYNYKDIKKQLLEKWEFIKEIMCWNTYNM